MLKPQLNPIRIAGSDRPLSKGQKTFNSQIRQIEKLRTRLAAWDAATTAYQEKYTRELAPVLARATELQVRLVYSLDCSDSNKSLTRGERRRLRESIVDRAAQILAEHDDAELKAVYNKHSGSDYDSKEAARVQGVKDFLEDMFDLDLGADADFDSPDDVLRQAQTQFREKQELYEAEQQAQDERRAKRKKSPRQLEKEARAEADAKRVSQSLREIYRKLASAIHPDRETDPQERQRKTALMQRINQAYDKKNLLQLLELQLELEHIDGSVIAALDDERLRHYNAVLAEQLAELRQELAHVEYVFCERFGFDRFVSVRPETVVRDMDYEILRLKQENHELERDLVTLSRPNGVKAWLKKLTRQRARDDFGNVPI